MQRELFILVMVSGVQACGNGSSSDSVDSTTISAGGAIAGTGGGIAGGAPSTGGSMSACVPSSQIPCACPGGAQGTQICGSSGTLGACNCDVPAGRLACGGKQCETGGHCTIAGLCPGFLGDCFAKTAGFDACSDYCASKGLGCAEKACNPDGTSFDPPKAFTWVAYTATHSAVCASAGTPDLNSQDACGTPIWLSASMPSDSVVRCCCQ